MKGKPKNRSSIATDETAEGAQAGIEADVENLNKSPSSTETRGGHCLQNSLVPPCTRTHSTPWSLHSPGASADTQPPRPPTVAGSQCMKSQQEETAKIFKDLAKDTPPEWLSPAEHRLCF